MKRKHEFNRAGLSDISGMNAVKQHAIARSSVQVTNEIYESLQHGALRDQSILENARFSGVIAAKNTPSLLADSFSKQLTYIQVRFDWKESSEVWELHIEAEVKARHAFPVHTEAMMAASIAALAIYDSCSPLFKSIVLGPTYLSRKV